MTNKKLDLNNLQEWRTFFNPAFCGEIVRNTIKEYEEHDLRGLPFAFVFFILPLILHPNTSNKIRLISNGHFFSWLDVQSYKNLDFSRRTQLLKETTLESLYFLSIYNKITVSDSKIKTIEFDHYSASKNYSVYMRNYQKKARQVGRWFSQTDSLSTIYLMLGVSP